MKRVAVVALMFALSACNQAARKAERKYATAERVSDFQAACDATHEAMDAYLTAGDAESYKGWAEKERGTCALARLSAANVLNH